MESNRTAEEMFIRWQDLLVPDELDGESGSQYTPGSARRDPDSHVSDTIKMRPPMPRTRDFDGNLFLRSQDLLEPDELEMESSHYRPGSARRKPKAVSRSLRSKLASIRSRGFERIGAMRQTMTGRIRKVHTHLTGHLAGGRRHPDSHPAKWTSIAAGTGVGVGIMSRMLRARRRRELMPSLVLIEAC